MPTTFKLRISTETRRLTTNAMSQKKLDIALKDIELGLDQWTETQLGEVIEGASVTVLTSDGYPIRTTSNGMDWEPAKAQPFFAMMRG